MDTSARRNPELSSPHLMPMPNQHMMTSIRKANSIHRAGCAAAIASCASVSQQASSPLVRAYFRSNLSSRAVLAGESTFRTRSVVSTLEYFFGRSFGPAFGLSFEPTMG